ncbi:MAG TPA: glycosyltransferase, partial [Spirochaetota bacterium]
MGTLHDTIRKDLSEFLDTSEKKFPVTERLTIDLHCHDHNSSEPDELLGRMLGIPETWLASEDLVSTLGRHGCDTFTITNHNNVRSCYNLIDKGYDILPAAEYSCMVPSFATGIHVLAYGVTPVDDERLRKVRSDIMKFLDYTTSHNIPTICAHPLYHYKSKGIPPMEFFDLLLVLFERFEVINGQRDSWQNMLVKSWLESATPEAIDAAAKKHSIDATRFTNNPYRKVMAGGSDAHMGIFAGLTGSYLHVANLSQKIKSTPRSALALDALRACEIVPFGSHNDSEKMTVAFIDYFCQIALHMEDPGLLRILLHKGDAKDKAISLFASNLFGEMRRHKTTMGFLRVFHEAFTGKTPSLRERFLVKKEYQPAVAEIVKMANTWKADPEKAAAQFSTSLATIFESLMSLAARRAEKRLTKYKTADTFKDLKAADILSMIELPSRIRTLAEGKNKRGEFPMSAFSVSEFVDDLSFPLLGSSVILAADFAGAKVMYNARPLVRAMAQKLGKYSEPERILWLTDTFEDANGVATVLREMHREVKKRNLPIDFLVCSDTIGPDKNLIVTKPIATFTLPFYEQQPVRIPNMMELQRIFHEGEYNRIVCSTEGFMGMAALYLKHAFTVPAHFYLHTDWMTFARTVLGIDHHGRSRLRRILRAFYRQFDSLLVLNSDQRAWLMS